MDLSAVRFNMPKVKFAGAAAASGAACKPTNAFAANANANQATNFNNFNLLKPRVAGGAMGNRIDFTA